MFLFCHSDLNIRHCFMRFFLVFCFFFISLILSGRWLRTASVFKNGIRPKKSLQSAFLAFFGDICDEILNKTVFAQLFAPMLWNQKFCEEQSYENLQSWHSLLTLQSTNYFLHQCADQYLTGESFFTCLSFLAYGFLRIHKIERYLVNINKH